MLPRITPNIVLESFCNLVSVKSNGEKEIINFHARLKRTEQLTILDLDELVILASETTEGNSAEKENITKKLTDQKPIIIDPPYNTPNSENKKAVEIAANSGSVSSLHWLIESAKVDITANDKKRNLLDWACPDNDETTAYLLDPQKRRWEAFQDGTTDLLAHVAAGRIEDVKKILDKDIDRLCDSNHRHQNAFYWAKKTENEDMLKLLTKYGNKYLIKHKHDLVKIGKYYACLGHFNYHFYHPETAIKHFEKSIHLLSGAIIENHRNDLNKLNVIQCISLQYCGRLYQRIAQDAHRKYQNDFYQKCLTNYLDSLNHLKLAINDLQLYPHLRDSLLMETAEIIYAAIDKLFAQGESLRMQQKFAQALSVFEKAIQQCDSMQIILSLRVPPIRNESYLQKFWDLDTMTRGHANICSKALQINTQILDPKATLRVVTQEDERITGALNPDDDKIPSCNGQSPSSADIYQNGKKPNLFRPATTPMTLVTGTDEVFTPQQSTGLVQVG